MTVLEDLKKVIPNKIFIAELHYDAGHAWATVPVQLCKELKIDDKITYYSYISNNGLNLYLEEDCDLYTFVKAMKEQGYEVKFNEIDDGDDSFIRKLEPYYTKSNLTK